MIKQQGIKAKLKSRQQGAVAIIVAICLVVLIGMLGLVLDLGHLYIAKTELQNAADAAALSGAKELDGTRDGVIRAKAAACEVSGMNEYDLSSMPVADTTGNPPNCTNLILSVGSCPSDGCMDAIDTAAASDEAAAGRFFMKVDTGPRTLNTWFARIWNIVQTRTFGMAVAGRFKTPITPLGVCAIDPGNSEKWVQYGATSGDNYKLEYGFAYGVSYDLGKVNKVIGGLTSGSPLYLHPTAQTQEECVPDQNNANYTVPFMCTGQSTISGIVGSYVYANTGWGGQNIYDSLNTRFVFDSGLSSYGVSAATCPSDANIKEFKPDVASGWMKVDSVNNETIDQTASVGSNENDDDRSLMSWLAKTNVIPFSNIRSRAEADGGCNKSGGGPGGVTDCTNNYGVLWSYARPKKESGSLIPPSDWNTGNALVPNTSLYREGPTAPNYPTTGYDPSEANLPASPYAQGLTNKGTDPYYQAGSNDEVGRRVLNLVILNCEDVAKAPGCDGVRVLSVGKFFMQTKADFNGKKVEVEYAGLVPEPELTRNIRLYR